MKYSDLTPKQCRQAALAALTLADKGKIDAASALMTAQTLALIAIAGEIERLGSR